MKKGPGLVREPAGDRPGRRRLLHFLPGPPLHHPPGQTPNVPTVAVYRERVERRRQLADNGIDVPRHMGRGAREPGQGMRSESVSGRIDR